MIGGKRTRSDQAHVSAYDVPELGQFVGAGTAQEVANDGKNPRIVPELEEFLPFGAGLRVAVKMLRKQASLSVYIVRSLYIATILPPLPMRFCA